VSKKVGYVEPVIVDRLLYLCFGATYKSSESYARAKKILLHMQEKKCFSKENSLSTNEVVSLLGLDPGLNHNVTMAMRAMKPLRGDNKLQLRIVFSSRKKEGSRYWLSYESFELIWKNIGQEVKKFLEG
jgi:hypothetical protein